MWWQTFLFNILIDRLQACVHSRYNFKSVTKVLLKVLPAVHNTVDSLLSRCQTGHRYADRMCDMLPPSQRMYVMKNTMWRVIKIRWSQLWSAHTHTHTDVERLPGQVCLLESFFFALSEARERDGQMDTQMDSWCPACLVENPPCDNRQSACFCLNSWNHFICHQQQQAVCSSHFPFASLK